MRALAPDGDEALAVTAQGFGPLAMTWIVPRPGRWQVQVSQDGETVWSQTVAVGEDRRLKADVGGKAEAAVETRIRIERVGD